MMKMKRVRRLACVLGVVALIVAGALALTTNPVEARPGPPGPPGPLCGWTTIWDCTLPDGSAQKVIGTQCDIARFEKQTGASCVPASF